jgi:stress-induced morphogen
MGLEEKVERALRNHFRVEHLDLVDDEGITGVMVSPDFEGVGVLDRHARIDRALRDPSGKLTRREQRRVVLIAPFTPAEFGPVGPDEDEEDSDEVLAGRGSGTSESFADLLPKVEQALRIHFRIDHLKLVDDDGIFGSMVSPDFDGLSMSDRDAMLQRAFRDPASNLTDRERRRIRFIMTRTPAEYEGKLFWDSLDGPSGSSSEPSSGNGPIPPSSHESSGRREPDR